MIFYAHLHAAVQLIAGYDGGQPFAAYLKSFFKTHKKYGSKDRKNIAALCYACWRLGRALPELSIEERIRAGLFLSADKKTTLLEFLPPLWNEFLETNHFPAIHSRVAYLRDSYPGFLPESIFPCVEEISEQVNKEPFILSHLQQPDLFIRMRPGHEAQALARLKEKQVPFELVTPNAVRLPNGFPVDDIAAVDREIVVQDLSSQRTGDLLIQVRDRLPAPAKTWDCCAGGGGKSILAHDLLGSLDIAVTDIRKNSLSRLTERFARAGIKKPRAFVMDLSGLPGDDRSSSSSAGVPLQPNAGANTSTMRSDKDDDLSSQLSAGLELASFDLIIVDAPCTGSGTWSRIPERLSFFTREEIDRYAVLQRRLVKAVLPFLKKQGYLLYITCSVFRKENEEAARIFQSEYGLELLEMRMIEGYAEKADALFAALFKTSATPA